ncbi:hypothetical protein HDU67_006782 [Dinochytrium kinnereticum]|nr:hypothetical protein HDU67_006782 [Dinochytrium kinnereticum]
MFHTITKLCLNHLTKVSLPFRTHLKRASNLPDSPPAPSYTMPHVMVAADHGSEPVSLYYEVHGSGPQKILFVGGFGNVCHQWDMQVDFFSKIPDYSVCIFDNRGAGLSSSPKGRYKTSEMAMDARDLINHLGWEKFHLVGLSMGGMIAQELAHLCRKRLLSLTLESTYAYFNGLPMVGYQGMVAGAPKGEKTVHSFASHVVNNLLFPDKWLNDPAPAGTGCETNREHMIKWMVERFTATGLQDPQGRANQQVACMTHWMTTARLKEIRDARFPVLVMTGTDDNVLIQPSSSIYLAAVLGGRLEIFEGGGHALRVQFPERHNHLLLGHLKGAWRLSQARLSDALAAALAAGAHVSGAPRPSVVWGGETSHHRGWVEEKDPAFPGVSVERHVVEEVEFVENLVLPNGRRPPQPVVTASVANSTFVSASSSPRVSVAQPRTCVPTSVGPAAVPLMPSDHTAKTTIGILYSWSSAVIPTFLRPAQQPPPATITISPRPSSPSLLHDFDEADSDDEVDGDLVDAFSTPNASIYLADPPPRRSPSKKMIVAEGEGEEEGGEGEGGEDGGQGGIVRWVGSSFKFGFGDFVSMIPGTPT